jgi:hypothetical protein
LSPNRSFLYESGHQSSLRDGELFVVIDEKCAVGYGCKADSCLDTSCTITGTGCFLNCQMFWAEKDSTKELCQEQKKCNWDGEPCVSNCDSRCKEPEEDSFCAYCYNDAHCVEIPGISSEEECEGTEACLLLDGTIDLISKEECLKVKGCTQPCHDGMSCISANNLDKVCISPESKKDCTGVWMKDLELCTHPLLSQSLCSEAGWSFLNCQDISLEECSSCYR